ncbi:hypothetical protein ACIBL3_00350 [Kribbella sp. NPDC050124]|uniref:hypothetical protein n=1 Tax=Kribbella sp. NPDC050124 TaxID=3364114 RepID=UPI00378B30B8
MNSLDDVSVRGFQVDPATVTPRQGETTFALEDTGDPGCGRTGQLRWRRPGIGPGNLSECLAGLHLFSPSLTHQWPQQPRERQEVFSSLHLPPISLLVMWLPAGYGPDQADTGDPLKPLQNVEIGHDYSKHGGGSRVGEGALTFYQSCDPSQG